jgi:hypothetical protein
MNGKPTNFVEKIWESILTKGILCNAVEMTQIGVKALPENYLVGTHKPKLHTIREDKKDRWKVGTKIDFFINCRQKDMFRFAPVLPVVSTQKISIEYIFNLSHERLKQLGQRKDNYYPVVYIDNAWHNDDLKLKQLAQNDGFDTIEDFFAYFNEDFTGKIIHWTDLRY